MKHPEQAIQCAVMEHLWRRSVPGVFSFHCPNGGWRSPIEAKVLKGLGVVSGVPDVFIIAHGKPYALELKTETGKLTPVQRSTHVLLQAAGVEVAVAYGIDAAVQQLEAWSLLRGRTT
jgi:hypothetical protein